MNECPVCMNVLVGAATVPCGHAFCESCLLAWAKRSFPFTCPTCRASFNAYRCENETRRLISATRSVETAQRAQIRSTVIPTRKKVMAVAVIATCTVSVAFVHLALALLSKIQEVDRLQQRLVNCH
jgi:hypothetical protein